MNADIAELLGLDPDDPVWSTPIPCEGCGQGNRLDSEPAVRLCRNQCCVEEHCPACDLYWGGWGPAGCRCPDGPNPAPHAHGYRSRFVRNHRRRRP